MFQLDPAIAEWRRRMADSGLNAAVVLDELESHLREDIDRQVRSGLSEQAAFEAGVLRIGRVGALKYEFAKVDETRQVLRQKAVWALLGVAALSCWVHFGGSPALALVYGIVLAGLVIASFVDFKHFIIPDEITIGGIFFGFLCSSLVPSLHGQNTWRDGMFQSLLGIGAGAGLLYLIGRLGKLAFGQQRLAFLGDTKIIFTDAALVLPEKEIPYADLFYRKADVVSLYGRTVTLAGLTYQNVPVRLTSNSLQIGDEKFNPAAVTRLEVVSGEIVLPREAMGLGDVKFMAAIGAFLGWQAVCFSLIASSLIGSSVGVGLIAVRRREWSSRVPYGPYLALAAAIWIFGGKHFIEALLAP